MLPDVPEDLSWLPTDHIYIYVGGGVCGCEDDGTPIYNPIGFTRRISEIEQEQEQEQEQEHEQEVLNLCQTQ